MGCRSGDGTNTPEPMMPLTTKATRLQRPTARTTVGDMGEEQTGRNAPAQGARGARYRVSTRYPCGGSVSVPLAASVSVPPLKASRYAPGAASPV